VETKNVREQTVPSGLVEASIVDKRSKVRSSSTALGAANLVKVLVIPVIGATFLDIGATSTAIPLVVAATLPGTPLVIAATSLATGAAPSADHIVVVISRSFQELARTTKPANKQRPWARISPMRKVPECRGNKLMLDFQSRNCKISIFPFEAIFFSAQVHHGSLCPQSLKPWFKVHLIGE
jgi:hypothetical protein